MYTIPIPHRNLRASYLLPWETPARRAILVWHFYQVFFDPDVYPMNWAWWDGKMPVEHYRHEHELDAEAGKPSKE